MNLKNSFSYFACIIISGFIAYFINGKGGVMLCLCLILAILLSLANFLSVRKKINVKFLFENISLRKGDVFSAKLVVSKTTFLPTPYVKIKFKSSPKLVPINGEIFKTALFFSKKTVEISPQYKAVFSGKGTVEIEYIRLADYLGLFYKNIYVKGENDIANPKILPDIPQNVTCDDLLKTSADAVAFDDNDEDTGETIPFGQGTAGYEHRPYVVGDPIKKINWKLSSKRDIFMIRLDEKIAVTNQILILDVFCQKPSHDDLVNNDNLIEGFVGLALLMLRRELVCDCWFYAQNGWQTVEVKDEKSLNELQKCLENHDETLVRNTRLPQILQKEKGSMAQIIFTNNFDQTLANETEKPFVQSFFVTVDSSANTKSDNMWCINNLFEIKRI